MVTFIAAIFVAFVAVLSVELWLEPLVRLDLLVMGGALLLFFQRKLRRFAAHYLVMGEVIAGCGLLPLFSVLSADPREVTYLLPLLAGMYLIVGGILDHLLLVCTMKSLPEENDETV